MIIINARFLTQKITGVQRYAIELSRALKKIDPTIRFFSPKNIIHHDIAIELGVESFGNFSGHMWEQTELPLRLRKFGNPLLLSLAATAPIFYENKIGIIADLAYLHFPDAVSWKFRTWYSFLIPRVIKSSFHIVTISDFSKRDIVEKLRVQDSKISVIYISSSFSEDLIKKNYPRKPVLIAVGSIQPYKNLPRLIEGFREFKDKTKSDLVLKLIGDKNSKVFKEVVSCGDRQFPDIEMTGYITDSELLELYNTSTAFVFPSLFEGFGLPPIEAMACGCPVIASNAASMPEICGNAALYFDPQNASDIADKIEKIVGDVDLQKALIERGFENAKRFNWDQSATKLFAIIKKYSGQ